MKVYGPLILENITHQSKILNATITTKEVIEMSSNSFKGEINNNTITLTKINNDVNLKEITIKSLKIAIRWPYCVNCYNCATWCPTSAIVFTSNKPNIISNRCKSCNICLEVCPISEVYVEKLLLPQILNKSRGRKRPESTATLLSRKLIQKTTPKEKELPNAQWFFSNINSE
ncbi:MAG: hypothetical protein QW128_06290 [Thermoprotei archaeon]